MLQVILGFAAGLGLGVAGFLIAGGGVPGIVVALVAAAGGYVGVSALTTPDRKIGKVLASALPNGQKAADAIDDANERLKLIEGTLREIQDPTVRAEANDFVVATRDLVRYVGTDPGAWSTLRHYITVYGEQTSKLLESYVDVERSGAGDQLWKARQETIEALQVLEKTAAGELSRAVSSKTLGISADSDAIVRLARMDGYEVDDDDRHAPRRMPAPPDPGTRIANGPAAPANIQTTADIQTPADAQKPTAVVKAAAEESTAAAPNDETTAQGTEEKQ
ncbi:5-bromo-4-chloroindolyl phosphate hydrolysis family protein [Bifidobacterium vespertilionis]|uniref:5-bromo-4-chloroindolyl phosphate hydrolysis family protein n=1 Tax=Bifidobacterium vespertilionis TaxID=2562524 RepID=UPI001BDC9D01|nr:5-bromo-4-chloroindolyl phosphate hydrolysis family protein [Bifidobacterium vespertilionis]MBT1178872.1 5-bromo-4-chloroindolyl phosphate hydrolysis family protein [Bifidobacterium vespertilionis]